MKEVTFTLLILLSLVKAILYVYWLAVCSAREAICLFL